MALNRLPFSRSYEAIPGKLVAGFYPTREYDYSTQKGIEKSLDELRKSGITAVIDLTEKNEQQYGQSLFDYHVVMNSVYNNHDQRVISYRMPIPDVNTPTIKHMQFIMKTIHSLIEKGHVVYVHCFGGKGRTGTVIGCYLIEMGINPDVVLDHLNSLRHTDAHRNYRVPDTHRQEQFIINWTNHKTLQ